MIHVHCLTSPDSVPRPTHSHLANRGADPDPTNLCFRWNILEDHGTSHLSIVDSERNAVSMTSTVNAYFGSLILSPRTGVLLNNEMDDFSMPANASENSPPPAPANFVSPLKRPLSSMTPTVVVKVTAHIARNGS